MQTLKVDGGDVENLTNWKAKQLLKNVVLGTLVPFQMNMLYTSCMASQIQAFGGT
jgi:hypothetical protein